MDYVRSPNGTAVRKPPVPVKIVVAGGFAVGKTTTVGAISEISARLRLHLDVTRILVDDLRAAGYLDVHAQDAVNPNDPATILRVIRGLRALS